MSLRIRRGTEAQRLGTVAEQGEILWTTDTKKLYVGTGATNNPGNSSMANILETSAGTGLIWNPTAQQLEIGNFSIDTSQVTESPNFLYFTAERAQDAAASLFVDGAHSGISFVYNDIDAKVNATVSMSLDALTDVTIVGTPSVGQVLKWNGSAWVAGSDVDTTGLMAVVDDTSPQLGGDLDLNTSDITGLGNINITGTVTATALVGDLTGNVSGSASTVTNNAQPNITSVGDLSLLTVDGPMFSIINDPAFANIRISNSFDTPDGSGITVRRSRGTSNAPTAVAGFDYLASLTGWGYTSNNQYVQSAAIKLRTSNNVNQDFLPGFIEFHTTNLQGQLTRRGFFNDLGQLILNGPITCNTTDLNPVVQNIRQIHGNAATGQFQLNRARGTISSLAAVQGQDELGNIAFIGHDGTAERWGANVSALVDSTSGVNISTNQIPTKLVLSVNPGTSGATPEAAVVITSDKVVDFKGTALAAGSVDIAGGVVEYLRIKVNGVDRAIPLYAVL